MARLDGKGLTIEQVVKVARFGARVELTSDEKILRRINAAHDHIVEAARAGKTIYGVTTGFGGMAHTLISPADIALNGKIPEAVRPIREDLVKRVSTTGIGRGKTLDQHFGAFTEVSILTNSLCKARIHHRRCKYRSSMSDSSCGLIGLVK